MSKNGEKMLYSCLKFQKFLSYFQVRTRAPNELEFELLSSFMRARKSSETRAIREPEFELSSRAINESISSFPFLTSSRARALFFELDELELELELSYKYAWLDSISSKLDSIRFVCTPNWDQATYNSPQTSSFGHFNMCWSWCWKDTHYESSCSHSWIRRVSSITKGVWFELSKAESVFLLDILCCIVSFKHINSSFCGRSF